MKNGYDQFFKNARRASNGAAAPSASARPQVKRPPLKKGSFNRSEEKVLSQLLPKKKRKPSFPWKLTLVSLVGFVVALWGYQNHDQLENLAKNIEIGFLGTASAESAAPAAHKDTKESKDHTAASVTENKEKKDVAKDATAEKHEAGDLDYLQKLNERKKALDEREQELARQDEELQKQRVEIERRLNELKEMRGQISSVLDDRVKVDDQKVDVLVQTYSNMKPPQAAKILESMDEDLAVEILGRMKKKNAADVMNLIKPEKAQAITEKFAGYKRRPAASAPAPSSAKSPATNGNETNNNKN